jgi:HK97 gp10 family phage protein
MAKAGGGIVVTGTKDIDKALARFDANVQKKITRKATRAGAKLVLEAAKVLVPSGFGDLERSLKVKAMEKRKGKGRGRIGHSVRTGEGFFQGEQFYGGFLEFGTKERKHDSGKSVGAIPSGVHDYLRPALYQNKGPVKALFEQAMREAINEANRKKVAV